MKPWARFLLSIIDMLGKGVDANICKHLDFLDVKSNLNDCIFYDQKQHFKKYFFPQGIIWSNSGLENEFEISIKGWKEGVRNFWWIFKNEFISQWKGYVIDVHTLRLTDLLYNVNIEGSVPLIMKYDSLLTYVTLHFIILKILKQIRAHCQQ